MNKSALGGDLEGGVESVIELQHYLVVEKDIAHDHMEGKTDPCRLLLQLFIQLILISKKDMCIIFVFS